jgi:hypothetical protein
MTLAELLAELEARDVSIEVVGGRLRLEASPGAAPGWLLAALAEHRALLLALPEPETGAAETAPAALLVSRAGDVTTGLGEHPRVLELVQHDIFVSRTPHVVRLTPLPAGPEGTLRIPLDDLVYGDFLARHRQRIVDGAAYPDGRTYRPTIYLADDSG